MSEEKKINITDVTFGSDARKQIKQGVDIIADAVKTTLGARGRHVVIERGLMPHLTKDGVTVANSIFLDEPIINLGAQMARQAANQTVMEAGDGTSTSTVLVQAMVEYGMKLIENGGNPVQIQREMQRAAEEIEAKIDEIAEDATEEQIRQIAIVSTNGDQEIGNAIADAYIAVGTDGKIFSGPNLKGTNVYSEKIDGMKFDKGFIHEDYINKVTESKAEYENPNIAVVDAEITELNHLKQIILANEEDGNKPLVIFSREINGSAHGGLSQNFQKGTIRVLPINAPGEGEIQKSYLADFAIAVGATLISPKTGLGLESFEVKHFGSADLVSAEYQHTTIKGRKGDQKAIEDRVEGLRVLKESADNDFARAVFEDRIALLSEKCATIYIGGSSDVEVREKIDRIDDAMGSTKWAIEEGIVPGGGATLNYIGTNRKYSPEGCGTGHDVVLDSCLEPMTAILDNGGLDVANFMDELDGPRSGVNVLTGEVVDMIDAGIIDPAKVVKCCVRNAASTAGAILTTECTIHNKRR